MSVKRHYFLAIGTGSLLDFYSLFLINKLSYDSEKIRGVFEKIKY